MTSTTHPLKHTLCLPGLTWRAYTHTHVPLHLVRLVASPAPQVADRTEIFEGSIIRVARRLDELMQQLARAARVIGDEGLAQRFEESDETLRRGIMFSASLYL